MTSSMKQRVDDVISRLGVGERVEHVTEEPELPPAEYVREQMARRAIERWELIVPPRFRDARLERVDEKAAGKLGDWLEGEPLTNLVIGGPVAVGKTWASLAAVRPLVETGRTLAFWPLVELLDQMRPGGDPGVWDHASTVDVLILDDLGAERPTEWTAERLYSLVNRRWMEQLPIVATTNLTAETLEAAVGERVFSRLVGGATTIRLSGRDRRRS